MLSILSSNDSQWAFLASKKNLWSLSGKFKALTNWQVGWERTYLLPPCFWLTERRHCAPAAVWPAWPAGRLWLPGQSHCVSGRRSTKGQRRVPPASGKAARCLQNPPSERGREVKVRHWNLSQHTCTLLVLKHMLLKDTALAWLMPTKTATQRMTLDHSLLNLWGSPRRWSMQGYSSPITAGHRVRLHCQNLDVHDNIKTNKIINITNKWKKKLPIGPQVRSSWPPAATSQPQKPTYGAL